MSAGQEVGAPIRENRTLLAAPLPPDEARGTLAAAAGVSTVGLRPPFDTPAAAFSSRLSRRSHLDRRAAPSPNAQLAAAFTALGDRENANEIRYRAREHERELAWNDGKWGTWLLLSALSSMAGYVIGLYTFRVLWWVLGFSLAGAVIL